MCCSGHSEIDLDSINFPVASSFWHTQKIYPKPVPDTGASKKVTNLLSILQKLQLVLQSIWELEANINPFVTYLFVSAQYQKKSILVDDTHSRQSDYCVPPFHHVHVYVHVHVPWRL